MPVSAWDRILERPDLSQFAELVRQAAVVDLLRRGDLTVLAPTNDAIEAMRRQAGGPELLADPQRLAALIQGHVVLAAFQAEQIFGLPTLTAADLTTVPIDPVVRTVGDARIVVPDLMAGNGGVVQIVDSIVDTARAEAATTTTTTITTTTTTPGTTTTTISLAPDTSS